MLWQLYTWRMSYVYLSLVCVRYYGSFTPDDYCMYNVCVRCYGSFTLDDYCMHTCLSSVLWQLYTWRLLYVYLFFSGVMAVLQLLYVYLFVSGVMASLHVTTIDMYTCLSHVMAALHLMTIACILVCLRCYGSFTPDDYCMYTCLSQVLWQLYTWWLLYVYLFVSGVMVALHLTTIVCILVCLRCYGSFTSDDYCVYTCLSQMLWQLSTWRLLYVSKS